MGTTQNASSPHNVLILGAGKIGSLVTCLLAESGSYNVYLGSLNFEAATHLISDLVLPNVKAVKLDAQDKKALMYFLRNHSVDAIISCLPYYCNKVVAEIAADYDLHYFDLTEDVSVTNYVRQISEGKPRAFMPQCGLAPGFISIAAHALMQHFDEVDTVKMRVGALPVNPNNVLKYSLTWSTDGVINEYGNLCYGIENGQMTTLLPLEGYETITLDGVLYEAFNTSGGLGTLADTYAGNVQTMNYKTIRYPGHCKNITLLMNDLKLNKDRPTLKRILENAIPKTLQDVVLIYVAVSGRQNDDFFEENYLKKIYPQTISGRLWSSIQVTTAAGACSVIDIVLNHPGSFSGFVRQESIEFSDLLENQFGKYYAG